METEKLVYSCNEVSRLLACSRNLCYRLAREKKLPGVIFLGEHRICFSKNAIDQLLLNGDGGKEDGSGE